MNREIELVLPYPPSANRYFRVFKGRAVESAMAKEYKKVVASLTAGCVATPWQGPIILHLDVFRPRKAGDLSNTVKVLEDALRGIVYVDDSQVVELHPRRFESKDYPRVQVRVVESHDDRRQPAPWTPPVGWDDAVARMEAVREKDRERDRKRLAAKDAGKEPEGPSVLRREADENLRQLAEQRALRADDPPEYDGTGARELWCKTPESGRPKTLTPDRARQLATDSYRKGSK